MRWLKGFRVVDDTAAQIVPVSGQVRACLQLGTHTGRNRVAVSLRGNRSRWRPEFLYTFTFPTPVTYPPADLGYRLEPATLELLRTMRKRKDVKDRKFKILRGRLGSDSERCWVILDGEGTPCGYCHAALSDNLNERINHRVSVGPEQAYFYDDAIFPRYRRRGLHSFSIAARSVLVADEGIGEALTTISRTNLRSIGAYGKFGARRRHLLVHVPALRRTWQIRLPRIGSWSGGRHGH